MLKSMFKSRKNIVPVILLGIILALMVIVVLYPMIFVIQTSFKTYSEFIKNPFSLSLKHPSNYKDVLTTDLFYRGALNSLIIAVVAIVCNVVVSGLAIFAVGVLKFKGSGIFFYIAIFSMFITGEVGTIPMFLLVRNLGLIDSLAGVIFPSIFASGGMGMLFGIGYVKSIPDELHEAAALDGATIWQMFWKVDFIMMLPLIALTIIGAFNGSWNQYIWPYIVLPTNTKAFTIQMSLIRFKAQDGSNYGQLCAGMVLVSIPGFVLYGVGSRWFGVGMSVGAIKG